MPASLNADAGKSEAATAAAAQKRDFLNSGKDELRMGVLRMA